MKKLFVLYCLLLIVSRLIAQDLPETISGDFRAQSFADFVKQVEQRTSLKFYFLEESIEGITVDLQANNMPVEEVLTAILENTSLSFYAEGNLIILYQGEEIVERLPDYKTATKASQSVHDNGNGGLSSVEQKYLQGRSKVEIEEITIGKPDQMKKGKNAKLSGRIFEKETGTPLIGATLLVEELGRGAVSDYDGYFSLVISPGDYIIRANSLSMGEKIFHATVYSDDHITINMENALVDISEVVVVADRNQNVTGMQMGYDFISSRSIKEIPTVMGEKDVLKVAQMLPGVQSAGEGSSGLIVRGGSADQNLFYINKLPIYNTSHLFGFFSAFSPDIINNFSLYKSNIPAQYGGRVSSVFNIDTRQGNKKKFFGKGGISPVTGHIAIEGPVIRDKSSFVLSYRGTYSDWILNRVDDINIKNSQAGFYDVTASLNTDINDKNLLKIFGFRSADQFSLSRTNDYQYSNTGGTISWRNRLSNALLAEYSVVLSQYENNTNEKSNPSEAYSHAYGLQHTELRADFKYLPGSRHQFSFGLDGINYDLDRGEVLPYGEESRRISIDLGEESGLEMAAYVSDEFKVSSRLSVLAGLRYSLYGNYGPAEVKTYLPDLPKSWLTLSEERSYEQGEFIKWYHGAEPRLALNYILGKSNSVKVSYNRIRQYLFLMSNTVAISPVDQWKLSDYHLEPMLADQISLGYYHDFNKKGFSTSAEVYRKWVNHVVEYKDGIDFISPDPTEMLLLQGLQNIYGAELMIRKNSGKLTGWISYSFSRSIVEVNNEISGENINYGNPYPSNYDQPHSFHLVGNYKLSRRVSFSSNLVYSSGRPITYPAAIYYSGGRQILHYSGRNEYRIPDYFRVDLSVNVEGNLLKEKWLHSSWSLDIYNLTGRKNAYSIFFEADEGKVQGYKLSIFGQPIVTLTWNFKFGNYASE